MSDRTATSSSGKGETLTSEDQPAPTRTPPNDGSPGAETEAGREKHACRCSWTSEPYREVVPGGWIAMGHRFKRVPPEAGCGADWFHRNVVLAASGMPSPNVTHMYSWDALPWQECEAGEHQLCDVIFAPNGSVCPCPCHLRGEVS